MPTALDLLEELLATIEQYTACFDNEARTTIQRISAQTADLRDGTNV